MQFLPLKLLLKSQTAQFPTYFQLSAEESFFYLEHEPGREFTHIVRGSVDAHLHQGQLEPNQIMYAGLLTGQFLHILGYENGQWS